MIYDILFAICGIGLIAMGVSLFKLNSEVESWKIEVMDLMKLITDVDNHRLDDNVQLAEAFKRIQELEERLEGQEAFTANLEEILNKYTEEDKE